MPQNITFSAETVISNVSDPVADQDAANRRYVNSRGSISGLDLLTVTGSTGNSTGNIIYNTDVTVGLVTTGAQATNAQFSTWTLSTALTNFTSGRSVLGITDGGALIFGVYNVDGANFTLTNAYVDRNSGLVSQAVYQTTFRQLQLSAGSSVFASDFNPAAPITYDGRLDFFSPPDSLLDIGCTSNIFPAPVQNPADGSNYYKVYFTVSKESVAGVADSEIALLIGSLQTRTNFTTINGGVVPVIAAINSGGTANLVVDYTTVTIDSMNSALANKFISSSQTSNIPLALPVASVVAQGNQARINFSPGVSTSEVANMFSLTTYNAIYFSTQQNVNFVFRQPPADAIALIARNQFAGNVVQTLNGLRDNISLSGNGIQVSSSPGSISLTNLGVTQLIAGSGITLSPSGGTGAVTVSAGGGGSSWNVGGNTFTDTATKVLGPINSNPLSIVSNNVEGIRLDLGFSQTSTSISYSGGTPGGELEGIWRIGNTWIAGFDTGTNPVWSANLTGPFSQVTTITTPAGLAGINCGVQGPANSSQLILSMGGGALGTQQGLLVINTSLTTPVIQRYNLQIGGTSQPSAIDLDLSPNGNRIAACWGTAHIGWSTWNATTTNLSFTIVTTTANFITTIQWLDDNTIVAIDTGGNIYRVNTSTSAITNLGTIPNVQQPFESTLYGSTFYLADYNGLWQVANTAASSWTATKVESWDFNTYVWATENQYAAVPTFFLGNTNNNTSFTTISGTAEVVLGRATSGNTKIQSPLVYLGDGVSNYSGIVASNAISPTAFTLGSLGQSLYSTGLRTYWGFQPVTVVTLPTGTYGIGSRSLTLTSVSNNLGLTVSGNSISGFIAGGLYEIFISFGSQLSASGNANEYFSLSTYNGIVTAPSYGTGASVAIIHTSTQPVGDVIQSTGYGHLNNGSTLYAYQYCSAAGSFSGNNFIKITRIS